MRPCPKEIKVKDVFRKRSYIHMNKEHTRGPEHRWQKSTVTTNRSPEGRLELAGTLPPQGMDIYGTQLCRHTVLRSAESKATLQYQEDDRSTDRVQRGGQHGRPRGSKAGWSERREARSGAMLGHPHSHVCTENRDRHVGASHELD